jgi:hypothetical protein
MNHDVSGGDKSAPHRLQFRFTLKTALITITLLSLCLGYVIGRQRGAAAFEAWDVALRNIICENIAVIPQGTALIESSKAGVEALLQERQLAELSFQPQPDIAALKNVRPLTSWSPAVTLDVAQELKSGTPIVVANRLLQHYESGLAKHGLVRIAANPGTCDVATSEPSSMWVSKRPELSTVVIIDVRVDGHTSRGDARIRHIGRPLAHL